MLPTKFGVKWLLGLGEEAKNRISRCLGFPIGTILAILSTSQPDASYQVWNQLAFQFRSSPSWISDRNEFSYF